MTDQNKNPEILKKDRRILGILGGLGPMASVYFYEMITKHTKALCDQDHIDIVISSRATTPDRTAYIIGASEDSPVEQMCEDARKLEKFGAEIIAIPCNTAHYFYESVREAINVPVLNIISETVAHLKKNGKKKAGILATFGTIKAQAYQQVCENMNIEWAIPEDEDQTALMEIIYNDIKAGKRADMTKFKNITDKLEAAGCDCVILGCTELSLIKRDERLPSKFIDSLEVLAMRTIEECGRETTGFLDI